MTISLMVLWEKIKCLVGQLLGAGCVSSPPDDIYLALMALAQTQQTALPRASTKQTVKQPHYHPYSPGNLISFLIYARMWVFFFLF